MLISPSKIDEMSINKYILSFMICIIYIFDCTSLTGMFILFKIRQKVTETVTCGRF